MDTEFTKMHCCGHDSLIVDWTEKPEIAWEILPQFSRSILKRHIGVGGNSLTVLFTAEEGLAAKTYNPLGETAAFYSDDIICASRYLFDKGVTPLDHIRLITETGPAVLEVIDLNNYRLDLGVPLDTDGQEIAADSEKDYTQPFMIENSLIPSLPITLGMAGRVVFSENRSLSWWKDKQTFFSATRERPVFTKVNSPKDLQIAVWQTREFTDYLLAGGIALAASVLSGFCENDCFIDINGFQPFFQWNRKTKRIAATAGARYVFSGNYEFEENENTNPFLD